MTNKHGDFIWYELLTSDADAAGRFLRQGCRLDFDQARASLGMDYRFFSCRRWQRQQRRRRRLYGDHPGNGSKAVRGQAWIGYIAVDDVDTSATAITAAGGSVLMPAMDLEGVGRMAMVADPQGAPFYHYEGRLRRDQLQLRRDRTESRPLRVERTGQRATPKAAKSFYTPTVRLESRTVTWTWAQWANINS